MCVLKFVVLFTLLEAPSNLMVTMVTKFGVVTQFSLSYLCVQIQARTHMWDVLRSCAPTPIFSSVTLNC